MKVEGITTLHGPRPVVWELLRDPTVLAKAMPGTRRLDQTAPGRYDGAIKVSVGPVTAAEFSLAVTLRDEVPPERFEMDIDSRGNLGFVRGSALVELDGGDETTLRYSADLQVGGKIAAVGQRVLEAAARMMTSKAFESVGRDLAARLRDREAR